MPKLHLLIKPASGLCNLKCAYCFYCDVAENRKVKSYGFMREETLSNVIKKALEFAEGECTIAFQGGEPTLAGLQFFCRVVELQKEYNVKRVRIYNAIQTNGYKLDEGWARFFRDNKFLVGLSLDGVKETHDAYRVDAQGGGTFSEVLKTAALLSGFGVEYNILTVVNNLVAKRAAAIYNFYKKNGFKYLQFIPCLDALNKPAGDRFSLTADAYGHFLCTLFDQWHADFLRGEAVSIRDFDNYIQMLIGYPPAACGMSGACSVQNVVEADGSVYPCDFYVLDELRLGNLNDVSFEEIYKRRDETGFIETSRGRHSSCEKCEYLTLCRGGCRRHRVQFSKENPGKTALCSAYKTFFDHSLSRLLDTARVLRRRI